MSKRIRFIILMMTLCATGIIGLQLYWNYKNFGQKTETFRQSVNTALNAAVDKEIGKRHQMIISTFKGWMADTTIVRISCDNDNRHRTTTFHMKDTYPLNKSEKEVNVGFTDFKESLSKINPIAKKKFIDHFGDKILREDLKKGIVYYYTSQLGERLIALYDSSKMDTASLMSFFKQELLSKEISAAFTLNPAGPTDQHPYISKTVNTALRRPYGQELIRIGIQSPSAYFFKEMKWLIFTSLLLISITLFCFAYTLRTLFTQHKLTMLKQDFINNMTHEINTPVSSILITVQSLKAFEHDKTVQSEFLDIIDYQGKKLKWLSSQILDTSKQAKGIPKNHGPVELNELVKKSMSDMEVARQARAAQMDFTAWEQPVYIAGDARNMVTVFTNIIDNALKYNEVKPLISISLSATSRHALVRFSDNGIGIPIIYRSRIFDDFFRVPKGNLHEVKGHGLGLSYVRQVVRNHKGKVVVEENSSGGSTFVFKFPLI